jgi:hypothetical protein
MARVQKLSNSECYTPSSEPIRIYLLRISSALKMETVHSSETSVTCYRDTGRHIPEDSRPIRHSHRCKNLKSNEENMVYHFLWARTSSLWQRACTSRWHSEEKMMGIKLCIIGKTRKSHHVTHMAASSPTGTLTKNFDCVRQWFSNCGARPPGGGARGFKGGRSIFSYR